MSINSLSSGEPAIASIVGTDPRQLRFYAEADQAYQIRLVYLPNPPAISADDDDLYVQDIYSEGVYLDFVRLVALSIGEEELSNRYRLYYEDWMRKNRFLAENKNVRHSKLGFKWL